MHTFRYTFLHIHKYIVHTQKYEAERRGRTGSEREKEGEEEKERERGRDSENTNYVRAVRGGWVLTCPGT